MGKLDNRGKKSVTSIKGKINLHKKPKNKDKKQKSPQVQPQQRRRPKHKWSESRLVKLKKSSPSDLVEETEEGDEDNQLSPQNKDNKITVGVKQKSKKTDIPSGTSNKSSGGNTGIGGDEIKKESLRERMMKRLEAARFRQINEELDSTTKNSDPVEAFHGDPEQFKKYHEAYRQRVEHWPKNPLNVIIKWIKKKLKGPKIIADFGCGEAKLAESVPNKVHSFDLFALNERVTACDMSKVPLEDESVDAAVFCLSLMGTDVAKFVAEANRVLKSGGLLKIAEVASRFSGNAYNNFLKRMKKFGFTVTQKGQGQHQKQQPNSNGQSQDEIFLMLEFKKIKSVKAVLDRLPALKLNPSVYKKR